MVDVDLLDRNVVATAEAMRARGLAVRPHAETHKCLHVAQRQIAAGASGLTVAPVAEPEVFTAAGVSDLFIAAVGR